MPLLQLIAACGSGVNTLVFHSGPDSTGYTRALEVLKYLLPADQEVSLDELLSQVKSMGFEWGVSDGT